MNGCIAPRLVLSTAILLAAAATAPAHADWLLGEYDFNFVGGFRGVAHSAIHSAFLSTEFGTFSGEGTIFEDIVINDGEQRVDEYTFDDDPDFARFVELITDGEDWYLYDQFNFDDGTILNGFGRESERLPYWRNGEYRGGLPGPDLVGARIDRVVRTISLDLETPGSDPNGDGIWTDVTLSVSTQIFGAVPAPPVIVAPLAGLLVQRRRRRPV